MQGSYSIVKAATTRLQDLQTHTSGVKEQARTRKPKEQGYMLTAFCDIIFVIVAILDPLAGLLSKTPVLWSGHFS